MHQKTRKYSAQTTYAPNRCRWEPACHTRTAFYSLSAFWSVAALPRIGVKFRPGTLIKRTDGYKGNPVQVDEVPQYVTPVSFSFPPSVCLIRIQLEPPAGYPLVEVPIPARHLWMHPNVLAYSLVHKNLFQVSVLL